MLFDTRVGEVTVSDQPEKTGRIDPAKDLGIPLFECRLAIEVALRAMQSLANRPQAKDLASQLEELAGLLSDCKERFELVTQRLDALFDARSEKPN